MRKYSFHSFCMLIALLAFGACTFSQPKPKAVPELITVEGLKETYASCQLVDFAVHNRSNEGIYVEVYAEEYDSGSWVEFGYAINDPTKRYSKMVVATHMEKGGILRLSFDRCFKPRFVKESRDVLERRLRQRDERAEKAGAPTQERIRVDARFGSPGARVRRFWSKTFKRLPGRSGP